MPYLRALLICGGAAVYASSRLLRPIYIVRPDLLMDSVSLLIPPGLFAAALAGLSFFSLAWLVEAILYRLVLHLSWRVSFAESMASYSSLMFLWVFGLLFVPGLPGVPMVGWWLLLDGSPWILTLIAAAALHGKVSFALHHRPAMPSWLRGALDASGATFFFGIMLLSILFVIMPSRRLSEPYDARWGTGDEPRYVRLAASLLYDGDADITNTEEHVGRRPEPLRILSHVAKWPGAALSTMGEVVSSFWSESSELAYGLGGQVIRGKEGGTYYVYLPGFPLLLTPAMTLDAYFFPGRLPFVILTCLIVGVLAAVATARLVEPYLDGRMASYLMITGLSLTLPMFFYSFQIYPEMAAALCLALMLATLLDPKVDRRHARLFGMAGSLLPWLHTRYYSVLVVCMLALMYRVRRDRVPREVGAWALVLPSVSVLLQCLYVFHITGSLLPDTLSVLNGYPRGGHLLNPQVLSGLYYLLLGREEGLLVYAPLYVLAVPGVFSLWRQSRFAACLSVAVFAPYLWISASHDQGGAGGWSPATRYLVPVTPVLALWLAAWVGRNEFRRLRWSAFLVALAASFWIAQGMLVERHFPYDRNAYLSSGVLNVSAGLGSALGADAWSTRIVYPALLVLLLGLVWVGDRRRRRVSLGGVAVAVVGLVLVSGAIAQTWIGREQWLGVRPAAGEVRLRPERATLLELPACSNGTAGLRLVGEEAPHELTVSGEAFQRHLVVPPNSETELDVAVAPVRRVRRGGSEEIVVVRLELEAGQMPLNVGSRCR
ncbi:MAG: hypothetical protein ACRD1X_17230 [Vicinamibacteria bacterium]